MFAQSKILAGCIGVLGLSTLIALPVYSQNNPLNRNNTTRSRTLLNEPVIQVNPGTRNADGSRTYPYSSRINDLGWITTPRGEVLYPNVGIKNGDGSTTYYYRNGARITIDRTKIPASGQFLR